MKRLFARGMNSMSFEAMAILGQDSGDYNEGMGAAPSRAASETGSFDGASTFTPRGTPVDPQGVQIGPRGPLYSQQQQPPAAGPPANGSVYNHLTGNPLSTSCYTGALSSALAGRAVPPAVAAAVGPRGAVTVGYGSTVALHHHDDPSLVAAATDVALVGTAVGGDDEAGVLPTVCFREAYGDNKIPVDSFQCIGGIQVKRRFGSKPGSVFGGKQVPVDYACYGLKPSIAARQQQQQHGASTRKPGSHRDFPRSNRGESRGASGVVAGAWTVQRHP
eukprot:GHVU01076941.1.p1 GENE.GHVU01076941.1~~GHVU01076941.1.p1  ORF type:complete len:276 (-),score=28.60 GHVU01076941.1:65-892(-)